MITANFSAYSTYVTDSLYQWDINQVLRVTGLNLTTAPEIHFSNANTGRAIVRQAAMESHVVTVGIPNSLLQDPLRIIAHIGIYEGGTFKVVEEVQIPVMPRKRPEDYQIEDTDEELYSFKRLENMLENAATKAQVANIVAGVGSDAELVDVRYGADGVTYASAGEAVREQVTAAKDGANLNLDSVGLTKIKGVSFTENILSGVWEGRILNTEGATNVSTTYQLSDYLPVSPGEVYYRRVYSDIALIGCYDADRNWITRLNIESGVNSFKLPTDCHYIKINETNANAQEGVQVYGRRTTEQFVPYGTHAFDLTGAELFKAIRYKNLFGKKCIFLGDSITYGVGATVGNSYLEVFQKETGAKCTNAAVSGASLQVRDVDAEYPSVFTVAAGTDFSGYDVAVIFAGTNDILANIGEVGDTSVSNACGALNTTFQKILTSNPAIKIVFFTPMFRARFSEGDGLNSDDNAWNGKYLYDLADKLEEVCRLNHIPCKNLYRTLSINKYTAGQYLADGLHPNDAGHAYLASIIETFVESNI